MTFLNFTVAELKAVKADSLSVTRRSHRKGDVCRKNTASRFPSVPLCQGHFKRNGRGCLSFSLC